jgi:hypothetical protein
MMRDRYKGAKKVIMWLGEPKFNKPSTEGKQSNTGPEGAAIEDNGAIEISFRDLSNGD